MGHPFKNISREAEKDLLPLWQQLVVATPNFPADMGSLRIMASDTVVAVGYGMRMPRKAAVYVFKAQNGYGNDLQAIHAQNGKLLWEQKASQDGIPAQITTGNNAVYLVTQHRFCAYRMHDGTQLWCTHTQPQQGNDFEAFEQTVFMNGMAYVGRGLYNNPDGLRIEAWDANKGTLHWAWPTDVSLLSHDFSWLFAGSNGMLLCWLLGISVLKARGNTDTRTKTVHDW